MENKELVELEVDGMTCSTCALSVEKYLKKEGAEDIYVNFATKEVRFRNIKNVSEKNIEKGIRSIGYQVLSGASKKRFSRLELRLIISAIFTFPLLLHMFLPFALLHNPWFQLTLSFPVVVIGFMQFAGSAWNSIKNKLANMDVLIFIGSNAAFIYSLMGLWQHYGTPMMHKYMFFETAASIITLILLGNWIEEKSVHQTTTALKDLDVMRQEKAKVKRSNLNGETTFVEMEQNQLLAGDIVLANSGDKILADGIILNGEADIDESLISGESVPVFKKSGATVISGTLVLDGNIELKVQKAGNQSTLAKITALVKDAQSKKPDIQKMGDRVSSVFVPIVIAIAVLTFFASVWLFNIEVRLAMMSAIAVLVISCPCAMGLATPTAIMVGVGRGAQQGILIKGGKTLEKLAKVKTVVFDKTGTLTTGNFRVKDFETFHFEDWVAQNIIYHLEQKSSHPIAKSVVSYHGDWKKIPFSYTDYREMKGRGVEAVDASGNVFRLGKAEFVKEILVQDQVFPDKDLFLSYESRLVAAFNIEDEIQEGANAMIQELHAMGIETVLLSGDKAKKCDYVAQRLGLKTCYAEQLPEQKLQVLEELSKKGLAAMVGDGINDAPALSRAAVGISLTHATDIAKHAADVILTGNKIEKVAVAIRLSRKTYATIKQNLFWALSYNVVAIPLAAFGFLSPIFGALSMAFSDVVVIGNSLRLKFKKV